MSKWFRLYNEVLNDPKVQGLEAETFKFWINILCIASMNDGRLPSNKDLSFHLRMEINAIETLVERLLNATLIDRLNGGSNGYHYAPHNWSKRQYKSDTSTDRVKRFRERSEIVTVTPPDTDTEQKKIYIHQPKQVRSKDKDSFDKFWIGYPRKVGKGAAEKAWSKALKETDATKILSALASYKFSEDSQFIPHPATWLNQKRFEDATETDTTEIKGAFITGKAAPNYQAWREHFENHGMKFRLASLDRAMDERKPFPVPSDFPLSG